MDTTQLMQRRTLRNRNNGIRPPASLRKTPVDAAARKVIEEGGRTIIGNLGNPGAYPSWGVMKAYHECFVDVVSRSDPNTLHGYGASVGIAGLQEAIAYMELENIGITVKSCDIHVGAGISNILDPLLRMIQSVYGGGNIIIPTPGYVLYHWEGERMGIDIRACRIERGQIDVDHLEQLIDKKTRVMVLYSVNNPISIPTTYDTFEGVFEVITKAERRFNRPIVIMVDDVYRVFQDVETQRHLPTALLNAGRIGPTMILDSISKMLGAAGDRMGYIKPIRGEGFKEKTVELIERLVRDFQITLGTVSMPVQLAFLEFLKRVAEGGEFAKRVEREIVTRRNKVRECNTAFMDALINEKGIRLHPQYGFDGSVDPNLLVAPYVVFGFDPEIMESDQQAAQLVLDSHKLGKPALLSTPMDVFEVREGKVWPGMRAVPMWDADTRAEVVDSILSVRDSLVSKVY